MELKFIDADGEKSLDFISDYDTVMSNIMAKKEEIANSFGKVGSVKLSEHDDTYASGVSLYDKGVTIRVNNTVPSFANIYDDWSSALVVISNNEIVYCIDMLDTRIEGNEKYYNGDLLKKEVAKLGKYVDFETLKNDKRNVAKDKIELYKSKIKRFIEMTDGYTVADKKTKK